jgi:iron complex outermembrane receptor protein
MKVDGAVKDVQGKPIADAQIRLFRQDSGASIRTSSNAEGRFSFERLAAGSFLLHVDKESFQSATRSIELKSSDFAAEIVLQVAGVNDSVVVTAAGAPQKLVEISKAVSTVSEEELRNRDEYALSDTLRTVPGVVITNGGGPGQNTSMRIRGLRSDAAAVLVDGLRFRDATTTQGDSSSFMSTLNIVDPDHIEVLRGSASSLYGTNAVAGVVNVVTQDGGAPLHGDWQAEGGSLGMFRTRVTLGGGALGDRLKFSAGLLHLNVLNGIDGHDANRSTGGQGFVRYDLGPAISLTGRLWGSDDFVETNISPTTTGIPAANFPATGVIPAIPLSPANVAILNGGGTPNYSGGTFVPGRDDPDSRRASRFYTGAFLFRQALSARAAWQASYQRVHTSRVYQNGPGGTGSQPAVSNYSRYAGDIDTLNVQGNGQLTSWMSVTGGYEFEREGYFDTQTNNLPVPRLFTERNQVHQNSNAGYFASQFSLLRRRLQISVSGRGQNFRLANPSFAYTGIASPYASVTLTAPERALTGDVSAAYLIAASNTKVRAHFGNAYRAPSLYERFGGGFSNNPVTGETVFTAYGDPRLSPDRYNSLDAGVDQYLFRNRARVSATWFYTRVVSITAFDSSGVIRPATDPYGRTSGYINGSGGVSRGAELAVEARPLKALSLSGSYTYVNENTDRDISVAGFWKILGVPAHTASFVATKYWGRRLDTTFSLFRSGGYYMSFFAGTRSRAFEFPGFTRGTLVASYRLWEGERRSVRMYGKVDNVFNQRYYQNGWLAAQSTMVVGLGYGF